MAYQVAQAYDENRNLVPLYVLTDGDVPEVSPGFAVSTSYGSSGYLLSIVQTSSNPTGGQVESNEYELSLSAQSEYTLIAYNESDFNISLFISSTPSQGTTSQIQVKSANPITINTGSTGTFTIIGNYLTSVAYVYLVCNIQRLN